MAKNGRLLRWETFSDVGIAARLSIPAVKVQVAIAKMTGAMTLAYIAEGFQESSDVAGRQRLKNGKKSNGLPSCVLFSYQPYCPGAGQ